MDLAWDTTTGKPVPFPGGWIRGHWRVAVSEPAGGTVLDLLTSERVFHRPDYKRQPSAAAVMPDDRGMVVGFSDGRLDIWDLAGESKVQRLAGHAAEISALALAPHGRAIVSASTDGVVRICAVTSEAGAATYQATAAIRDCTFRPDGSVAALDQTGRVHVLPNPLPPADRH